MILFWVQNLQNTGNVYFGMKTWGINYLILCVMGFIFKMFYNTTNEEAIYNVSKYL